MAAERVATIGAGRMGRGLAVVFAYAGHPVTMVDAKARPADETGRLRDAALGEVRSTLAMLARIGLMEEGALEAIAARVSFAGRQDAAEALAAAPLVFEAVTETLEAKADALALAGDLAAPDAIVASTTSTILSDRLAGLIVGPERFLNAHWLNPAFLVPLVEVSPAEATAPETVDRLTRILEAIGKVPVVCKASPGYIVPRIQALAMNEAARLVEEGVASAEDIDRASRYGFGFRFAILGLLEFIDWGGGDILYYADRYLTEAMGDGRFAAPEIVERNMREGRTGLRAGTGFHDFRDRDPAAYQQERLEAFVGLLRHFGLARPPVL